MNETTHSTYLYHMNMVQELQERFGAQRVVEINNPLYPEQPLLLLYLELSIPVTVLMTNGLSDYEMPVSEKWKDRKFNELYFCLPTYWDLNDLENPNFNWIYHWIFKLENFVRTKQTWFGPGHTFPNGNPPTSISPLMKQTYFILLDPLFLESYFQPFISKEKTVNLLAIVPLFGDELDFKMGKGTVHVIKRFNKRGFDERLDEYRNSFLTSRFRYW